MSYDVRKADRSRSKAYTEASYNFSDRRQHGIGRGTGHSTRYKQQFARAERRFARAVCRAAAF